MKILFSPSEAKTQNGVSNCLNRHSFIFPHLYEKRNDVLMRYQALLATQQINTLQALFGIKDEIKCLTFSQKNIFTSLTCKAVERYSGVAYQHLQYKTLHTNEQEFIDNNVIIFSNLFGPIGAGDLIPEYKLKQGSTLDGFKTEVFFKEFFTYSLDVALKDTFIIDLRASFYEKFYALNYPHITVKFLKNGKIVSHFAKAYRGFMLRQLAQHQPKNEEEFQKIAFNNLKILEIHKRPLKSEYIFEIID